MLKLEIILLSNNIVLPFQKYHLIHNLDFIEINKLFATQSIGEHGLGFLINVYEQEDPEDDYSAELMKKIVFDTGGSNGTFLHNINARGYALYDVDALVLSHWHYDHTGGFYDVLEQTEDEIPVICHPHAKYERFFRRSNEVRPSDLAGKRRDEILPLLNTLKIVNQEPIKEEKVSQLHGKLHLEKKKFDILNNHNLKIYASGEIPRTHPEEDFKNFFSLQDGVLKQDSILDDKCLIFEFEDHIILLNGCCHSGIMNTIDYVKSVSNKPISHIIGGFHLASASPSQINKTIDYLEQTSKFQDKLYMFPIHCTGKAFLDALEKRDLEGIFAFDTTVGTKFTFNY